MKDVMMKILITAASIAAIVIFILGSNGLQGDTQAIQDKSSRAIETRLQP